MSNSTNRKPMNKLLMIILSLAIVLIAGFGFYLIFSGQLSMPKEQAPVIVEPLEPTDSPPTAEPTVKPTAKPTPQVTENVDAIEANPLVSPTNEPDGDVLLASNLPADDALVYDEVTGDLIPKSAALSLMDEEDAGSLPADVDGLSEDEPQNEPATPAALPSEPEPTMAVALDPEHELNPEITAEPEPTPEPGPLSGIKIGIDPGHQRKGNNEKEPVKPGSKEKKAKVSSGTTGVSTKIPEHVTDLQISLKLRDTLEALGAEVLMTREVAEVNISNIERAQMMNEWGADLVLRIHCNGVSNKKSNGIGLYVTKTGSIAKSSNAAAKALLPAMVAATGARKDGIFKRDTYSGLNWSEVPSILVENGYMSNPEEDKKLNDPAYQQLLCNGMAQGIADYFERDITPEQIEQASMGGDADESSEPDAGDGDADGSGTDESGSVD